MQIDFDFSQLKRLAASIERAPEIVTEEVERFVAAATAHLQAEVQDRTPTTHGTLRTSIIGDVRRLPGIGVEGVVGTPLAYAPAVEDGSRPHMPPVEPLAAWARQKLGVTGREAERAAWAIARKIARIGTEGAHMFRDAVQANQAQIIGGLDECLARIDARLMGAV
jgi:hypothetical protein